MAARAVGKVGKLRTYRATDDLYERAMSVATRRGESLSEVIRRGLEDYVAPRPTSRRNPGRRATDGASDITRRRSA